MIRHTFVLSTVVALASAAFAQTTSSGGSTTGVQTDASVSTSASAGVTQQDRRSDADKKSPNSASSGKSGKSVSATGNSGASASGNANGNSFDLSSNTPVHAVLVTPVDAKHNKPGDPVKARTTQDVKQDGHVIMRKGTMLEGHVTQAQARSKADSQSALGIMFDNTVMKGGEQQPLHLSIQALAAAANQSSAGLGDDGGFASSGGAGAASAGGGLLGGAGRPVGSVGAVAGTAGNLAAGAGSQVNGTVGAATRSTGAAAGSAGGLNAAGQLMSGSSGVFGLQGLNLASAVSNQTEGSLVTSADRNVHLDSGTQMLLTVMNQQ
jgi:hypothetical protein